MLRIATWNVNSIRARQELLVEWLRTKSPDVVCLQETKVEDDDFPTMELQMFGYAVAMAGQRTYNGVAILSRLPMTDIRIGFEGDTPDADRRLIAATVAGIRVLSAYIPNGKSVESPHFKRKLAWLGRLREHLVVELSQHPELVVAGDFNVAKDERDVFDVERMRGQVHFHPEEHRALDALLALGLSDALRIHHQEGGLFSWWDYRAGAFRQNQGLRIDYAFLSPALSARCRAVEMDIEVRRRSKPSDHVPVVVDLE